VKLLLEKEQVRNKETKRVLYFAFECVRGNSRRFSLFGFNSYGIEKAQELLRNHIHV
jgi:hypothetical protein